MSPFEIFEEWFLKYNEQNEMILSTTGTNLQPSSRVVLLKSFDKERFVFYTNYQSKKAKQISENNKGCLLFFWQSSKHQVRIEGIISKISEKESIDYFESRPRESKISAISSRQSEALSYDEEFKDIIEKNILKYKNKRIEKPSYWGGFALYPNLFEFWKEMPHRRHL